MPAPTSEMRGKVAVVTGVTSGIGAAICARLLEGGARVVGIGRNEEKLAAAADRWGPTFTPVTVDLAARGARRQALQALRAELPRVDIIVNNAGECVYQTPLELDPERFAELLEVNVLAAMELVHELAPVVPDDGQIVNVSSVTARFVAHPRFASYGLTKTALERFTEALRLELSPRGVKVSLVVPGLVDTPIYDKVAGFDATRAALAKAVPEWLTSGDVADAVLWMLTRPAAVVVSELVLLPRRQAR